MAKQRTKFDRDTQPYQYVGVAADGKKVKGRVKALSREEALRQLQDSGITVITLNPLSSGGNLATLDIGLLLSGSTDARQVKMKLRPKAELARQLHQLLRAGMPVAAAFKALSEASDARYRPMLESICEQIQSGVPLGTALEAYPRAFDEVFVAYIKTAEETGSLVEGTQRLAVMLEKRASLERKIKAVTMYPKMVSGVIGLLVIGILLFIVPMYEDIYSAFNAELPGPTVALQNLSRLLNPFLQIFPPIPNLASPLIWGPLLFWGLRKFLNANRENRRIAEPWNKLRFRIPVFGKLSRYLALYRWASTLAGAQGAGVRLEPGLRLAGAASGSDWMRFVSRDVANQVAAGRQLSRCLAEHTDLFPPQFVALIATGEKSGDLDGMLSNVAQSLGEDIDMIVSTLGAKVEVILLLAMAIIVGGLLVVLYLPILNLMQAVMSDMGM